jgi:hypothetical protein
MPVQAPDFPLVTSQSSFFRTACKVKDFQCCVISAGDKLRVCWSKGNSTDSLTVSLNLLDVVEVRLPVFDDTVLIGRYQPVIGVRIACCSYRRLVCLYPMSTWFPEPDSNVYYLHNQLEIERHSIP